MKPRRKRCGGCGAAIIWARNDLGAWIDVDPQATVDRYGVPDPVVLWAEVGAEPTDQRVSSLGEYIVRLGGVRYPGPVWVLHMHTCAEMDKPIPWRVSARGRKLLEILQGKGRSKRGSAS